ncbi:MAG: GtrA family protein, partial [Spirochaetes bacterium]|nr:GtrA family protein [Spirochaetota bacterium]
MFNLIKKIMDISFIKFGIVGVLGTITNLTFFFITVDLFKMNPNLMCIILFILTGTQNYILNSYWTFNNKEKYHIISLQGGLKYLLTVSFGFLINILILNLLLFINLPLKVIAQALGVLS